MKLNRIVMDWATTFSLSEAAREAAATTTYALSRSIALHAQSTEDSTPSSNPKTARRKASSIADASSNIATSSVALKRCRKSKSKPSASIQIQKRRKNRTKNIAISSSENTDKLGHDDETSSEGSLSLKLWKGKDGGVVMMMLQDCRRLNADFYNCDALELAPRLLGKLLRRDDVVLQITEVEAYRPNDSACHGRFGVTARTAPVFGPGGHAYVYLCYGLHIMLNIVADREGVGAAVLIRSCAPVSGLQTIQQRRGQVTEKPVLLTGPGKVGQALGLTTEWSNHPLYEPGGLEVLDGPSPEKILVGPRVGIDYAKAEDMAALWRFAIAECPWISPPRHTFQPA